VIRATPIVLYKTMTYCRALLTSKDVPRRAIGSAIGGLDYTRG